MRLLLYTIHTRKGGSNTEPVSKDGKTLTVTQANATRIYEKKFSIQAVK
jgi:hypothetical protein